MSGFKPGDRVQAVQQEGGWLPRDPVPGTVIALSETYVKVLYDDPTLNPDVFWRDSGWRAWDGEKRWRLEREPEQEG